jgi:hypothetical protein
VPDETPETETAEVVDPAGTEEIDETATTFPASVVRDLRKENATYRVAAKAAEARADAAETRAADAEERLARKPSGDIGLGLKSSEHAPQSFASLLQ